ncbi:MAG: hypothetical protein KDB21_17350 [Acidimicrobiales bacterium]|nr:hypothetical protein [Acidimicrobiales bacterium]
MTSVGVIAHEDKVLGRGFEELRALLAAAGFADPPWYEVPKSKKAPKKIRKLVEKDGVDRLLVWGGDGTVRRAIQTVLDAELDHVSIGILPAGTANLLAKNLGIPIDLSRALDIALHGDPRPLDVGCMNGEYFAVMGGAGYDAVMIRDAEDNDLKERFGRAGYVWSSIRNTAISPTRAEVTVDGRPWFVGDATCVMVANVGTILGGITAFPGASPCDGKLDVGVVQARSAGDWLGLAARAVVGRAELSPVVDTAAAERIEVSFVREMPWEVDGGDKDRTDTFTITCVPAAVHVCQPDGPR